MRIQVECRMRHGSTEPYLFWLAGQRLHVAHVLGCSVEQAKRTFTVGVDDGRRFVLTQDLATRDWELEQVIAPPAKPARSS